MRRRGFRLAPATSTRWSASISAAAAGRARAYLCGFFAVFFALFFVALCSRSGFIAGAFVFFGAWVAAGELLGAAGAAGVGSGAAFAFLGSVVAGEVGVDGREHDGERRERRGPGRPPMALSGCATQVWHSLPKWTPTRRGLGPDVDVCMGVCMGST